MTQPTTFDFSAIGVVHSPYKEKFAIPRQPGLVDAAKGSIELDGACNHPDLVRGLESCSHIWVLFVFHGTQDCGWKPLVRPPRLGGNKKVGVLATRTTFRPNPIGMSVVKLDSIEWKDNALTLQISGLDLLDKTPVIDIKPYIPYSDSISTAQCDIASSAPVSNIQVQFEDSIEQILKKWLKKYPSLKQLIEQILVQDPRPAYKQKQNDNNEYGMSIHEFNIRWRLVAPETISVFAFELV